MTHKLAILKPGSMNPYYHEPDPQADLDGKRKRKKGGATVLLSGRGKHYEVIWESMEQWRDKG